LLRHLATKTNLDVSRIGLKQLFDIFLEEKAMNESVFAKHESNLIFVADVTGGNNSAA
jgi:hypothetical protein